MTDAELKLNRALHLIGQRVVETRNDANSHMIMGGETEAEKMIHRQRAAALMKDADALEWTMERLIELGRAPGA